MVPLVYDVGIDYVRFCLFHANAVYLYRELHIPELCFFLSKLWLGVESPFLCFSRTIMWVT
jgi:hypothetical protein